MHTLCLLPDIPLLDNPLFPLVMGLYFSGSSADYPNYGSAENRRRNTKSVFSGNTGSLSQTCISTELTFTGLIMSLAGTFIAFLNPNNTSTNRNGVCLKALGLIGAGTSLIHYAIGRHLLELIM